MKKIFAVMIICFMLGVVWYMYNVVPLKNRSANQLFDRELYPNAMDAYNALIVDEPKMALLRFNAANTAFKLGQYSKALTDYRLALELSTDDDLDAKILYNVGNTLLHLGKISYAIDAYKKSLALRIDRNVQHNLEIALETYRQILAEEGMGAAGSLLVGDTNVLSEDEVMPDDEMESTEEVLMALGLETDSGEDWLPSEQESENGVDSTDENMSTEETQEAMKETDFSSEEQSDSEDLPIEDDNNEGDQGDTAAKQDAQGDEKVQDQETADEQVAGDEKEQAAGEAEEAGADDEGGDDGDSGSSESDSGGGGSDAAGASDAAGNTDSEGAEQGFGSSGNASTAGSMSPLAEGQTGASDIGSMKQSPTQQSDTRSSGRDSAGAEDSQRQDSKEQGGTDRGSKATKTPAEAISKMYEKHAGNEFQKAMGDVKERVEKTQLGLQSPQKAGPSKGSFKKVYSPSDSKPNDMRNPDFDIQQPETKEGQEKQRDEKNEHMQKMNQVFSQSSRKMEDQLQQEKSAADQDGRMQKAGKSGKDRYMAALEKNFRDNQDLLEAARKQQENTLRQSSELLQNYKNYVRNQQQMLQRNHDEAVKRINEQFEKDRQNLDELYEIGALSPVEYAEKIDGLTEKRDHQIMRENSNFNNAQQSLQQSLAFQETYLQQTVGKQEALVQEFAAKRKELQSEFVEKMKDFFHDKFNENTNVQDQIEIDVEDEQKALLEEFGSDCQNIASQFNTQLKAEMVSRGGMDKKTFQEQGSEMQGLIHQAYEQAVKELRENTSSAIESQRIADQATLLKEQVASQMTGERQLIDSAYNEMKEKLELVEQSMQSSPEFIGDQQRMHDIREDLNSVVSEAYGSVEQTPESMVDKFKDQMQSAGSSAQQGVEESVLSLAHTMEKDHYVQVEDFVAKMRDVEKNLDDLAKKTGQQKIAEESASQRIMDKYDLDSMEKQVRETLQEVEEQLAKERTDHLQGLEQSISSSGEPMSTAGTREEKNARLQESINKLDALQQEYDESFGSKSLAAQADGLEKHRDLTMAIEKKKIELAYELDRETLDCDALSKAAQEETAPDMSEFLKEKHALEKDYLEKVQEAERNSSSAYKNKQNAIMEAQEKEIDKKQVAVSEKVQEVDATQEELKENTIKKLEQKLKNMLNDVSLQAGHSLEDAQLEVKQKEELLQSIIETAKSSNIKELQEELQQEVNNVKHEIEQKKDALEYLSEKSYQSLLQKLQEASSSNNEDQLEMMKKSLDKEKQKIEQEVREKINDIKNKQAQLDSKIQEEQSKMQAQEKKQQSETSQSMQTQQVNELEQALEDQKLQLEELKKQLEETKATDVSLPGETPDQKQESHLDMHGSSVNAEKLQQVKENLEKLDFKLSSLIRESDKFDAESSDAAKTDEKKEASVNDEKMNYEDMTEKLQKMKELVQEQRKELNKASEDIQKLKGISQSVSLPTKPAQVLKHEDAARLLDALREKERNVYRKPIQEAIDDTSGKNW